MNVVGPGAYMAPEAFTYTGSPCTVAQSAAVQVARGGNASFSSDNRRALPFDKMV